MRKWMDKKTNSPLDSGEESDIIPGISCRICGCPDIRTRNTVKNLNGTVTRYKNCRNCGLITRTVERVNDG